MEPDAPLSLARGVEHRTLEADDFILRELGIVEEGDGERLVTVKCGKLVIRLVQRGKVSHVFPRLQRGARADAKNAVKYKGLGQSAEDVLD